MKIYTSYSVKLRPYNSMFRDTVRLYRAAVDFFIDVITTHWDVFEGCTPSGAVTCAERLAVPTKRRPVTEYDFTAYLYKFPSYMRRSAIRDAYGLVRSYRSNLERWEGSDPHSRGNEPAPPKAGFSWPSMFHSNTYERDGLYTARIKVFVRNTWDWVAVTLKKSDVDYIGRHCRDREECSPKLARRGKQWFLDFPFEEYATLGKKNVYDQTVLGVDLGINNACTCCVMRSDGAVAERLFLKLPAEYDRLKRKTNRVVSAQHHGAVKTRRLWAVADGINDRIAVLTARFIIETATKHGVDTIVFEHLDRKGKNHNQAIHLWRTAYVRNMVTDKAHRLGMRVSTVNPNGTSMYAFDGSGRVRRGGSSAKTGGNYTLCEFKTGKVYNCDLNASYNIAARYFVREISKTVPATEWQRISAKVPGCAVGSTCTLSTLISLDAELRASA